MTLSLDPRLPFLPAGKDEDPLPVEWLRRFTERFYEWHRDLAEEMARIEGGTFVWTPTPGFATPGNSVFTPSVAVGRGFKAGNEVKLEFTWVGAVTHSTASGNLRLTGSPFALLNISNYEISQQLEFSGFTKAGYSAVFARMSAGSPTIQFDACGSGVGAINVTTAEIPSGGTLVLRGTIKYRSNN